MRIVSTSSTWCFASSPAISPIILSVDDGSPPLRFSVQLSAIALSATPLLRLLPERIERQRRQFVPSVDGGRALIARAARLPQHITALERGDVARGDEQMVRQAVEVGEELRVERVGLVQRNGGALGAANDRSGEMECGNARRTAGQYEAFERRKSDVHEVDVALNPLNLRSEDA